jgi:hypothetical protein
MKSSAARLKLCPATVIPVGAGPRYTRRRLLRVARSSFAWAWVLSERRQVSKRCRRSVQLRLMGACVEVGQLSARLKPCPPVRYQMHRFFVGSRSFPPFAKSAKDGAPADSLIPRFAKNAKHGPPECFCSWEKEKAQIDSLRLEKFLSIFRVAFLPEVLDTFGDFISSIERRG